MCSSMFCQCAFLGSLRNCGRDSKFRNRILTRNTEWKTLGDVSTDGWIILKHIVKCIRDVQFIDRWSYFHLFKKSSVLYISYQTTIKYVVCLKSKSTDFLFNYLLYLPEITSYLLRSITLGKLHSGSNISSTDHSSTGSHFP